MKLSWNFLNPTDGWSEFMQAKFISKSRNFSRITKGSSIWAGVRGAIEDVRAYSGWVIGDGASIDLWRDNWCSSLSLKDWINDDHIPWNDLHAKLSSIIVEGRWAIPGNLQLLFQRLGVDIHSIKINKNNADRRVWKPDLMGKFSVKGAFEAIRNKDRTVWWASFLSNKAIHPRLAMWGWRLCHRKIPTDDKVQTKGLALASRYCLCKTNSETIQHLIWDCSISIQLWNWMADMFQLRNLDRNLYSFLRVGSLMSFYLRDLWAGAVWGGSSLIWQARNNCLYEALNFSLAIVKWQWLKRIQDCAALSTSFMFNTQIELGILHCLGVDVHACKHPLVKSCYWELPRIGEIKINTDGAAKGNPGKGGIGCIYRDCNGNVLGTLTKGLGLVSNFIAECEAIIHGVEYAASFGWLIAWIESDSTTAVEAFKTNNIPWTLVAAWENASRNMRNIQFSANWREANFSADALSKKGALLHEGVSMYVMGRPDFLKKIEVPMQEYFRLC
ncbi:hypothetical protein GIB67_004704 [Kingdonia uniflora]|uniref:RNase H type-1 domain-containing protein n=1 Tax=Kingdonia uniflora TaxID=39325 RepID=A0A7J7P593_9MAGN|nr:hypothetical protein GIB67_004704 [Kingdonia uniflora]